MASSSFASQPGPSGTSKLMQELLRLGHPGGETVNRKGYVLCYNYEMNVANYVYTIVNPDCYNASFQYVNEKHNKPKPDKSLPEKNRFNTFEFLELLSDKMDNGKRVVERKSVKPEGYQLGHQTPRSHHYHDEAEIKASDLMSNAALQATDLNKSIMTDLEKRAIVLSSIFKKVHEFTGNIFTSKPPRLFGTTRKMGRADYVFKLLVLEINETLFRYECYIFKNDDSCDINPNVSMKTLPELNKITKLNFLNKIPSSNLFSFDVPTGDVLSQMVRTFDLPPGGSLPIPPTSITRKEKGANQFRNKKSGEENQPPVKKIKPFSIHD